MDLLAERQASVIGVGRSHERNRTAAAELRTAYPQARVEYLRADLASQAQVRRLAADVHTQLANWGIDSLRGLLNNAAMVTFRRERSEDGFEKQWAANHLAPFLLTHELLPLLQQAQRARVVTVSSGSHRRASIDWDHFGQRGLYNPLTAYASSKLANVLFSLELDRRTGPDLRAFAADPGLVDTAIGAKAMPFFVRWFWKRRARNGISPRQAAVGVVKVLIDPELDDAEAIYWRRGKPVEPAPQAQDAESARRLWRLSREMCGL